MKLRSQGGIKALLGVVRCDQPDVLSQVARGIANFAKCESRASSQGLLSCQYLLPMVQILLKMDIVVACQLQGH